MSNETLSNSAIDYSKEVQTHLTHEKLFRQYLASHKDFTNYLKFRDALPRDEHLGHRFADEIYGYIAGRKGRFLRDENGAFHVLIDGKRVPLICSHENAAWPFAVSVAMYTHVSSKTRRPIDLGRLRIRNTS